MYSFSPRCDRRAGVKDKNDFVDMALAFEKKIYHAGVPGQRVVMGEQFE